MAGTSGTNHKTLWVTPSTLGIYNKGNTIRSPISRFRNNKKEEVDNKFPK